MDLHLARVQQLEQLVGLERVPLVGADDERIRRLVPVDPVAVHAVVVLHPRGPMLRHLLERREDRREAVVDDVAQPPRAPVVGQREVHPRRLRAERHVGTGRVHERVGQPGAGDLGQDARLSVVEHVLPRRGPQVVLLVVDDAPLALRDQRCGHGHADLGLARDQQRVDVGVVRVLERRHEDAGAGRPHLVHVVGDLRLELAMDVERQPGLLLREHEPVAVVVVSRIVMVEVRVGPVVGGALGLVPVVDHQHLPVGVL